MWYMPRFPGCTAKHLIPRCLYLWCTAWANRVQNSFDVLYCRQQTLFFRIQQKESSGDMLDSQQYP